MDFPGKGMAQTHNLVVTFTGIYLSNYSALIVILLIVWLAF